MNETVFKHFVKLITFDSDLGAIRAKKEKIQQEIDALSDQQKQADDEYARVQKATHDMRKIVDEQELAMRELDEAEKAARTRLDSVATQKEYQALKNEIDLLKQKQHDFEQELVAAWGQFESAQEAERRQLKIHEEQTTQIKEQCTAKQEQIAQLQADLDVREVQRPEVAKQVPDEWMESYNRMRERVQDPVVSLNDKNCAACFTVISDQDMIRLRRRALITCKGCFRLLYVDAPQEAGDESEPKEP